VFAGAFLLAFTSDVVPFAVVWAGGWDIICVELQKLPGPASPEGLTMEATRIDRLCDKARQAIAERDWDKAKQAYLLALGLKSDAPDIPYGLATVFFQLRELTSAAHHFREVTRLDAHRAGAFVNLGAVLNVLGQLDDSLAALRRGIQLDPRRVEAFYNLGL